MAAFPAWTQTFSATHARDIATLIGAAALCAAVYWLELAGEDDPFAALEASTAAVDVTLRGPGLATASVVDRERVPDLALTHAAGELLGRTDASVESARTCLEAASLDRSGSVAVRARDVRSTADVDTQRAERELGQVLVDRGFDVDLDDPDHTLRALFAAGELARDPANVGGDGEQPEHADDDPLAPTASDHVAVADGREDAVGTAFDVCLLGWVDAERAATFGDRAPTDRPFFQPGSMDPLLARALANLAGARPGATIVDPMCGTGGTALEAALVGARAVGVDAQAKMAHGARENLTALAPAGSRSTAGTWDVVRGDARRLPIADDAADGLVVDVPYERQSAVAAVDLDTLVTDALAEARRVADRAVVVADRSWVGPAREAGWTVECVHRRRVHRSLVRWIHVLEREAADVDVV